MKRYLTYDACNGEFEVHDTIEEAREYLKECYFDPVDLIYHPDTDGCQIFELKEAVSVHVLGRDGELDKWEVKFKPVKEDEK